MRRSWNKGMEEAYLNMRRFYTENTFPKDGEHILIDGQEYVAHLKDGNEGCDRCCFNTTHGCGVRLSRLDCFDMMHDMRYFFTKEAENGKENG